MIDQIVKDYTRNLYNDPKEILAKLNYFRKIGSDGLHLLTEIQIANLQKEFIKFFNVNLAFVADTYPTKLFRLTNNKNIYDDKRTLLQNVTDLLGPPDGLSNIGRCNLKGESVFYSALDFNTAIWETQPEVGDLITVSQWKIKDGRHLNTHTIFHPEETILNKESKNAFDGYLQSKEQFHPHYGVVFHEILKFLCEEFMKPVDSDKKINYLFSAIISSRFLQAIPDENGFKIDSISYPSVKRSYGVTNLAISNSVILDKLDLEKITVYTIGKTNYDPIRTDNDDLILVTPDEFDVSNFDYENNKIIYDKDKMLKVAMEALRKYGK